MPLHHKPPPPLTIDELRALWLTNRNPDVRRALEELVDCVSPVSRRSETAFRMSMPNYHVCVCFGQHK